SASPLTRLIATSPRPSASMPSRGPISAFRSGSSSRSRSERGFFGAFGLSSGGVTAGPSGPGQEVADRRAEAVHVDEERVVALERRERLEVHLPALGAQDVRDLLL